MDVWALIQLAAALVALIGLALAADRSGRARARIAFQQEVERILRNENAQLRAMLARSQEARARDAAAFTAAWNQALADAFKVRR